jgi:hypothetical protein
MTYSDFKTAGDEKTFTINGITYETMLDTGFEECGTVGVILQEPGMREWSYVVEFDLDTNEVVSVNTSEVIDVEEVYPD